MGGYNSGSNQPRSRYGRIDNRWTLDVNKLQSSGRLKPGNWGEYDTGLVLMAKQDHVVLNYLARFENGSHLAIGEPVYIVRRRRHFGGSVPYFICPGEGCGRRVSKLYISSGRYRCRKCSRLKYFSQYENVFDRTLRRRDKIGHQLGIDPQNSLATIEKPKKMRRKIYEKLVLKFDELETRFES